MRKSKPNTVRFIPSSTKNERRVLKLSREYNQAVNQAWILIQGCGKTKIATPAAYEACALRDGLKEKLLDAIELLGEPE